MDIKLLREVVRGSTHAFDMVKEGVEHIFSTQQTHCDFNGGSADDAVNMPEDTHDAIPR